MKRLLPLLGILALFVAFAAWRNRPVESPPVFDHRPFAELQQAAQAEKKWLIVKTTATWCPPCKEMDRTTFVDPDVVGWLQAHALAAHVDVDQHPDLANAWGIEGIPTMIAFRDGQEVARTVGGLPPQPFLQWLQGLDTLPSTK